MKYKYLIHTDYIYIFIYNYTKISDLRQLRSENIMLINRNISMIGTYVPYSQIYYADTLIYILCFHYWIT